MRSPSAASWRCPCSTPSATALRGVRVDAVAPGPTVTPLWTEPGGLLDQFGLAADGDREQAIRARGEELPAGRMAEPAEIADVIVFLLAARRGDGAVRSVDGGHVTDVFP
jgi:NAD(P)-dependent dehydrogenase (short-subunit alcohol dehydrogenase family)